MATTSNDTGAQVKEVIDRLNQPVPDLPTLLALLTGPLDCIGLLSPQFRRYNAQPLPKGSVNTRKHIPPLQRAILEHIAPTWDTVLAENNATVLLQQYFCPDAFCNSLPVAGEVAMFAYSMLMTMPLNEYAMHLLERLATEYPVDRLHRAAFARKDLDAAAMSLGWEDCIRNIAMVPAKVANAVGGKGPVLPGLEHGAYFNNVSARCEQLIASLSVTSSHEAAPSVAYLLEKLVNLGVFPPTPPVYRSQPSFFQTTLPRIRARLADEHAEAYSAYWSSVILVIPSSLTLQSILTSLFASLSTVEPPTDASFSHRAHVKLEAKLLSGLLGTVTLNKPELWETATNVMIGRDWEESYARIFVCWVSGGSGSGKVDYDTLGTFLDSILDTWASPEHIKHSLLSRHRYVTSLLIIAVSYFPPSSPCVQSLALLSSFIQVIGIYISHLDNSVRHCGMLAAEVVAQHAGKHLDFKDWEGDDSGKPWARELRQFIKTRDVDADLNQAQETEDMEIEEITAPSIGMDTAPRAVFTSEENGYDSDDSITGYASPSSSRSASPTPSELAEIEIDPTLNVGLKKVPRPVYLAQLGDLLRGSAPKAGIDEPHDADRIEMGLNYAEELIRKKRGYGTELDENAANLTYILLGLQDNYNLEGFDSKRQGALNALVACAPRKVAPALIEEFFKNQYSTGQRYVALNALALGARELASLPFPPSSVPSDRTNFPSKLLPEPLHRKYITSGNDLLPRIMDDISRHAIDKQKEPTAEEAPQLVRERRLRVQRSPGISEATRPVQPSPQLYQTPQKTTFSEVAAEFFVMPLVNRFWLFLRDEQTREERTASFEGRQRYHGAGTGLILNPLVLSHFLRTLAILVHASQNVPEWLSVIAPETLELAVTLGTRPVSRDEIEDSDPAEAGGKEASVLASALELALVALDGCLELDGGRVLCLEHTALLLGTGEWASKEFASLERGIKVEGGGGLNEVNLRRVAAGVLLKIDDLTSRWRRSMLDTR